MIRRDMSEQSDKPAQTNKTNTTDTASDAKTGKTQAKTSNNEATVKAGKGREESRATTPSDKASLDIPSSEEAAAGNTRKANGKNKSTEARQAQKKAPEKGLFEPPQSGPETVEGKKALSDDTSSLGANASKTKTSSGKPLDETAASGNKKTATPKRKSEAKTTANTADTKKEAGPDKKGVTRKKPAAEKDKKPSAGSKAKTGGKRSAAGARMTSGGDATIERKPALTTTTPIRKRKSDGGGGLAVLIALLFVLVAAGYYFLTQTGTLNLAQDGTAEPTVTATEGGELENPAEPAAVADAPIEETEAASNDDATSRKSVADAAPSVTPEAPAENPGSEVPQTSAVSPDEDAEVTEAGRNTSQSAVSDDAGLAGDEKTTPVAPKSTESAGSDITREESEAEAAEETAADSSEAAETASPALLETPESEITTTMANTESTVAEDTELASVSELTAAGRVEIEELLIRLQIDPGPADGVIDNQASVAIRLYQEIAGLPVDGKASPELLTELREVVELLSNE